jgi:NAD(P)-dependent dehydrogenase (short-subunit alcohol dehydrogenase family)
MTGKVAIVTGASRGIGAGLIADYRRQGWAVVTSARTITPSEDPGVLTVTGDNADAEIADRIIGGPDRAPVHRLAGGSPSPYIGFTRCRHLHAHDRNHNRWRQPREQGAVRIRPTTTSRRDEGRHAESTTAGCLILA